MVTISNQNDACTPEEGIQCQVTKKERQSNIELLRIVAMFLVLVVHADVFSLGMPTIDDINASPAGAFSRFFFEALSIMCVNTFVMISGWFGIRARVRNMSKFIFQCLFFLFGIYIICGLLGKAEFNLMGLSFCFCLQPWNWFIKSYLFLCVLSPALNFFIEHSSKKLFKQVLLWFFIFQTTYGWMSKGVNFFEGGYSTVSFLGLYLLAAYCRKYPINFLNKRMCLIIYTASVLFLTFATYFIVLRFHISPGILFSYINPIVILSALTLLLYFTKIQIKSRIINFVGASAFAVFLLHTNPNLCVPYFKGYVVEIYNRFNGLECLAYIFFFLIGVFILAILIDQPRKYLWGLIERKLFAAKPAKG